MTILERFNEAEASLPRNRRMQVHLTLPTPLLQ